MTRSEASKLRDIIRKSGLHCTVPNGYGPDRYFAQIWSSRESGGLAEPVRFISEREWVKFRVSSLRADILYRRELVAKEEEFRRRAARSPIEIMIDEACGR